MNAQLVAITCWVIFGAILLWDLVLYLDGKPRNAISQVIIDASQKSPLVPWFIGFVMGALTLHWFD